ncbi:ATP-binding protein [Streptomyces sp. 2A115]|uniref:ATP-binding protein n=1 Tax=Streptomyces sp. 2A115 TaxID=3457439 RepID=UPI003FD2BF82
MTSTELPTQVRRFAMRFSSTPRGARLARRLCAERLDAWGIPYGSDTHDVLTLIAAELCANAVRHGHVSGRDFHVCLTADTSTATATTALRVEVTDTRGERLPALAANPALDPPGETRLGGRGLLLVEALADRWGYSRRAGGPGKTVWAECVLR